MPQIKKILLTGNPGVGKTTIIKELISELKDSGGFFTEEIREGGKRRGFKIITLDGKTGILAIKRKGEPMIGSYSVNITDLEEIAVKAVLQALEKNKFIVIDEIGKMEVLSRKFQDVVIKALESSKIVLGVIHRENTGFFKKIKEMEDVEIIEVNLENRKEVRRRLKELINSLKEEAL